MSTNPIVNGQWAIADPDAPSHALKPNADGSVPVGSPNYAQVAGNVTKGVLGATGAKGDFLDGLILTPAAVNPGNVTLYDGNTAIPLYVTSGNLTDTRPIDLSIGTVSVNGAWSVTTGASITVLATGRFT